MAWSRQDFEGKGHPGKQNVPVSCNRDQISVPNRKPTRKCIQVKPDPPVLRDNQKDSFRLPVAKACSLDHPNCISVLTPHLASSFKDMSFTSCLLKKERWNLIFNYFHCYSIWLRDLIKLFKAKGHVSVFFSRCLHRYTSWGDLGQASHFPFSAFPSSSLHTTQVLLLWRFCPSPSPSGSGVPRSPSSRLIQLCNLFKALKHCLLLCSTYCTSINRPQAYITACWVRR